MVSYTTSADGIRESELGGFFVGWPSHPTPGKHLELLQKSDRVVLAIDDETRQVVGFVTAVTDGVLSAYIPFLEVLPAYQAQGIGSELIRRMLTELKGSYMIDLLCDPELQSFYEKLGMEKATGMRIRNFDRQSGT